MANVTITAADVRPLAKSISRRFRLGVIADVGSLVYLHTDGTVLKADAAASASSQAIGIIVSFPEAGKTTGAVGDYCDVLMFGPVAGFSSLTPGTVLYASVTAGSIANARPVATKFAWVIGKALTSDVVFVRPFTDTFAVLT